jgi:hypothetical protein
MNGNPDRFHRSKGSTEFGNLLTLGEVCLDDRFEKEFGLESPLTLKGRACIPQARRYDAG